MDFNVDFTIQSTWVPFYEDGLTLISAWRSYHNHYKMWGKIDYRFPHFSDTVEVWEWVSNFIPHLTLSAITYPYWYQSQSMLVNGNWHNTGHVIRERMLKSFGGSIYAVNALLCNSECRWHWVLGNSYGRNDGLDINDLMKYLFPGLWFWF